MKKIILSTFILILIIIIVIFSLNRNSNNCLTEKFYHLNSIFFTNYITQQNFKKNINSLFINDTVYCSVDQNLQNRIFESVGKTLILEKGLHKSYILKIPSNIKIIIPKNTTIKLANDCVIDQSLYGEAVGDAVIQINGTENKLLENIFIELNGTIDGNKSIHPYSQGGLEGIDLKWVKNSAIYGSGSIINCNGDGLDIDVSNNCYVEGITFSNNDGGGVHFGSPRPIKSSFSNLIVGCTAESNGFLHKRSGFDQSWPNIDGVTYFNCSSENNFQNWNIEGSGSLLLNSSSTNTLSDFKLDFLEDALYEDSNKPIDNDLNGYKIKETGYYFLYTNSLTSNSNFLCNDNLFFDLNLISKKEKNHIKVGLFLLHKNDVLSFNNLLFGNQTNLKISGKLELIHPLINFYSINYYFKIFCWRVKSNFNKMIYTIYSFFF